MTASSSALDDTLRKEEALAAALRAMGSALVAWSGGSDSTYLAHVAHRELGEKSLAVMAMSPALPSREREARERVAAQAGFRWETVETREADDPRYRANPENRCYFCKSELYRVLLPFAKQRGFVHVLNGVNADDLSDFRPGMDAARESGVQSPLLDAGMTKADIRALSARAGLETAAWPASACLASRIPHGSEVTPEKMRQVDRAESALRAMGFAHVRVRHHGDVARIELGESDLEKALARDQLRRIGDAARAAGFAFAALDTEGYRAGGRAHTEPLRKEKSPKA